MREILQEKNDLLTNSIVNSRNYNNSTPNRRKQIFICGGLVLLSLFIFASRTDLLLVDKHLYKVTKLFSLYGESTEEPLFSGIDEESETTNSPFSTFQNATDVCIHPEIDIFDPDIMRFYTTVKARCQPMRSNYTMLLKGRLYNSKLETLDCWGRCVWFESSEVNKQGSWHDTEEGYQYECDHVEVRCSPKKEHIDKATHFFFHTQVVELKPKEPKKTPLGKMYNVYFITIDSHAYTQQFRNLNASNKYLTEEMEAILFPYMSRVSDGSRENAIAWWYGKLQTRIDRAAYGLPPIEIEPRWETKTSCKTGVDNETFLLQEFEEYGYMTNMAEDWWRAIDYACKGWKGMVTHHHFNPYVVTYEKERKLKAQLTKDCVLRHQPLLDYFSKFMAAYQNRPKFGWSWLVHIGHNNEWESRGLDQDLLNFLQKNKEELDNSFFFIAGDHGMRFTAAVKTKVGKLDVNNPLTLMSLPKELRKDKELMKTIRENAQELQTHFDTRATILDILKFQPAVKFHGREKMDIPGELGHSFLRKQPKPRTCRTLPIHIQSCICQPIIKKDLMNYTDYAQKLSKAIVDNINSKLVNNSYGNMCHKWNFTKVEQLTMVAESPINVEGVILATHLGREKEAQFRIFATGLNTTMDVVSLDRLDRYEQAGHCVAKAFQPICTCLSPPPGR